MRSPAVTQAPPLVSVVIPVYDGERFLAEALDSVFAQGYTPIEVIVVDDGSRDGSADVAARYPVRLVRQDNAGTAAARNAGIRAARGELIAFLDQDDLWKPEKLAPQVEHLARHPEHQYVTSGWELLIEPGTPQMGWWPEDEKWSPPSSWVVRRALFDAVGMFDERVRTAPDFDWDVRVTEAGVVGGKLPETLVSYRVHPGNGSNSRAHIRDDMWLAFRFALDRRRGGGPAVSGDGS
jgi:glycosyltransferase involved in cell wall biosynthesis